MKITIKSKYNYKTNTVKYKSFKHACGVIFGIPWSRD